MLLDVVMPDQSGLEVVPTLLHENPEAKVLVLSMQDEPRYVREAFAAGASGYVLKEAADTEVVAAIREVAGGGRYVHPELGARLVAAEAEERKRAEDDPLSDREREVLRLLALGHTNQEIAKQLYISVRTAETHRAHIMQKLRLRAAPSSSATRSTRDCWRSNPETSGAAQFGPSLRDGESRCYAVAGACGSTDLLAEPGERGARALERPAEGEDPEADPCEQQGDADDDAEERELRSHVARVQRGRQRRVGDPDVAAAVGDRLLRLRVDHRASSDHSSRRGRP